MRQNITLIDFVFPKLRPPKTWSDKCLKCPLSEDPSISNMVNVLKHCWNPHHSTFILFIDHFKINWVGKSLCYWHAASWDCLLTHFIPMKTILFLRETISDTNYDAIISETQIFFSISDWIFKIYMKFWKFWAKRWPS